MHNKHAGYRPASGVIPSAINQNLLPRDRAARVAGEEQRHVGDVGGLDQIGNALHGAEKLSDRWRDVLPELSLGHHPAGGKRVGADAARAEFARQRAGETDDAGLGRHVGGHLRRRVVEGDGKAQALEVISEHILPGRWADIRWPNRKELKATTVLKLGIDEASAKVRTGPPLDDENDYALGCWAGVLPLKIVPGKPLADTRLPKDIPVPAYARRFPRPGGKSGT